MCVVRGEMTEWNLEVQRFGKCPAEEEVSQAEATTGILVWRLHTPCWESPSSLAWERWADHPSSTMLKRFDFF